MSNTIAPRILPAWFRGSLLVAACAAIALGFYFRFARLGEKYFWFDEVHSAACVSGRPVQEIDDLFDGRIRRLIDLQQFLHLRPDEPISTTIDALIAGNPENTPLYFLSLRLWAEAFGDAPGTLRCLSALFGVAGGGLLIWLCRELHFSKWSTICVVAWWSLAPFFVLYGQEARTYSLFSLTVILANAMLLRALRIDSRPSWAAYGLTIVIGLYTHMFFGMLMIAQAGYVAALGYTKTSGDAGPAGEEPLSGDARRRLFTRFIVSTGCGVLLFLPWFVIFLRHARHDELAKFLVKRKWPHELLQSWIEGVGTLLVDVGLHDTFATRAIALFLACIATSIFAWSFRVVRLTAPRRTSLFIFATALIPPLLLILPDLVLGGGKSQVARYWLPGLSSFGLAFGYALGVKLAEGSHRAFVLAIALVAIGAISGARSTKALTWWHKGGIVGEIGLFLVEDGEQRRVLPEISDWPNALLVIEHDHLKAFEILAMGTMADPRLEWVGTKDPENYEPPAGREIFIYRGPDLIESLPERGWSLESLDVSEKFRHVTR